MRNNDAFVQNAQRIRSVTPHTYQYDEYQQPVLKDIIGLRNQATFVDQHTYIMQSIAYDLATKTKAEVYRNTYLQKCFQIEEKKYLEYCIHQKYDKMTVEEAGGYLGLRKDASAPQKHTPHH